MYSQLIRDENPELADQYLSAIQLSDHADAMISNDLTTFENECDEMLQNTTRNLDASKLIVSQWMRGIYFVDMLADWSRLVDIAKNTAALEIMLPQLHRLFLLIEPRILAAMRRIAGVWLAAWSADETRGVLYERIAALRPVEQNEKLQGLMGKNSEGTITPAEYAELVRLNQFFDILQAIIDDAITSTRQKPS